MKKKRSMEDINHVDIIASHHWRLLDKVMIISNFIYQVSQKPNYQLRNSHSNKDSLKAILPHAPHPQAEELTFLTFR